MATGTTTNNREFLFRLQTLIIDGGTIVVKSIFDQKVSNVPLSVCLATEKPTINRLRAQKTITMTQYDQLYPQSGQPPNSTDFDITLLICLLRNLRSLGLNSNYLWNVPPQSADTSVEADLYRLKGFRNEVAHISSTSGLQQTVFQTKWTEIEKVLLRLNSAVPNPFPNLKQTIDGYKNDPLDPVAEKRIQTEIKQWRKIEKGLETEMQLIKKDVTENVKRALELNEDVTTLTKDVKKLKQHVEVMPKVQGNIQTLIEDVKGANENIEKEQKNFELLKQSTLDLTKNVQEVTEGVREVPKIKGDFKELKEHVEVLKEDIKEIKKNGQHSKAVPLPVTQTDEEYLQLKQHLQDDLIFFYRDEHRKISLSPLIEETTPLLEFYVMPDIYSLEQQRSHSGVKQEKTKVTPLRNVFYNDDTMCRKIYLTADAGLGKTALSKRLALAWCHANQPHEDEAQYFSQEDIQAVNGFRFVFLLLLRNSSSECDIDDLIWTHVISQLAHDYTREDLVHILCNERCLVILDGLDEWSHPSNSCKQGSSPIPHRKARERTAVLTTTRPWKLSVSRLQSSQIDKKLELVGLNQESANALKRSVISHLCPKKNEWTLENHVATFTRAVTQKQMSDLEAIPLLLMYLLFLWCNNIELGQSQCDLYSQITELLLSRTVQNYIELLPKVDPPKRDIPQCLSGNTHCMQFYTLLTALGQLAYQTLFRETREENVLVFDDSVARQHLSEESLKFCLKTGLITRSKVPGTLLEQKFKVSFAHKTMQEFFAALYMHHSTSDQTSVPEAVLSKCKCIKDILEMSKFIIFSCGMNENMLSLISREMMKIINEDEETREYRSTLDYSIPLKDFQDMCISCCKEIPRAKEVSVCLQDVFIEGIRSCMQEQYRENLKQLTTTNKQNIRSLYIEMFRMLNTPCSSVQKIIEYFGLNDLENIETIRYNCEYHDSDILPLLNKSVKCLHLSCTSGSGSGLLFEKVTSLQKLEAIHIDGFDLSHSELTLLYDYISQRHCMRQIGLRVLHCTDHGLKSCTGCSLDLSHHSQLNKLSVGYIPVSELNINMAALVEFSLEELFNPDPVLRFVNCDPADSKLKTFGCERINSSVDIKTIMETLRSSVHVKSVKLFGIDLGNIEPLSSEMVNIEYVGFWNVTMTASVLQGIVDLVQKQPQTARVGIHDCDIKPESEFLRVKQEIKTSLRHFTVLSDFEDSFWFETTK